MSANHSRWIGALCLLATFSIAGCDDDEGAKDRVRRMGPSPISFSGARESPVDAFQVDAHGVTLHPEIAVPQVVSVRSACPARQPFQLPFSIVGTGSGRSDLSVHEVQMRFVDRAGIVGGAMTITAPQLVERFGSTQLPAAGTRSFPLALSFGCTGEPVGRLEVSVLSGVSRERSVRSDLSITVR
jgi:hypothetical protein